MLYIPSQKISSQTIKFIAFADIFWDSSKRMLTSTLHYVQYDITWNTFLFCKFIAHMLSSVRDVGLKYVKFHQKLEYSNNFNITEEIVSCMYLGTLINNKRV